MTSQTPTAAAAAPTTLTLQALDDAIGKAQEAPDAITKQAAAFGTSAHEIIDQCVPFFLEWVVREAIAGSRLSVCMIVQDCKDGCGPSNHPT